MVALGIIIQRQKNFPIRLLSNVITPKLQSVAKGSKTAEADSDFSQHLTSTELHPQDSLGGGFDSSQAFVGEMSQVGIWDQVLSSTQVASLARCGTVTPGIIARWSEDGVEPYGGATKDPGEPCSKHNQRSQ